MSNIYLTSLCAYNCSHFLLGYSCWCAVCPVFPDPDSAAQPEHNVQSPGWAAITGPRASQKSLLYQGKVIL